MSRTHEYIDLTRTSALQMGMLLARGEVTSTQIVESVFAAIDAASDQAVFIQLTRARALAEARESDQLLSEGRPRSALEGVPIAYKALIDLKGEITSAASKVILAEGVRADRDAGIVESLRRAGMVTIGHLNMTEFAFSALGLNPHFGTPHNPCAKDEPRAPGGSSSGSAVAVALGLVPVAIGSDTGGSIRVPAAFNGILGYKPSFGSFDMDGIFPLAPSLDTLGIFARTLADIEVVNALMVGDYYDFPSAVAMPELRIIVPTNVVLDGVEPAIMARFDEALARLAARGARIERRHIPQLDELNALVAKHGQISNAEAYAYHKQRLEASAPGAIDRRVAKRILSVKTMLAVDYCAVQAGREALSRACTEQFGAHSLLAMPATPFVAPPIAALEADDDYFADINMKTGRNARIGNMLDWPGLSIPMGLAAHDMPAGFLLCGMPGQDSALLAAAHLLEGDIRPAKGGAVA
ncbi:MAG: hypothetical protein KGQ46_11185 [Hyphomicrobiales bacterium]|nr:hypothetical protein [Hyphomicrobiales bacterium]MDE2113310.1 hypothetical protein [Hyphomicrobiales bacterium]